MPTPASSRGAPAFNGGTITDPLVIDVDNENLTALSVLSGTVGAGGTEITTDGFGGVTLKGIGGNTGYLDVVDTIDTDRRAFVNSSGGFSVNDNTGAVTGRVSPDGLMTAAHAAPADGTLANGQAYLWFDQTNGAAKLMVKAKQANGTVVTGSLALA